MSDDEIPSLVVDNGSGSVKAGFAGNDCPSTVFASVVGRARIQRSEEAPKVDYVGDEAQAKRDIVSLKYPIEHGIVTDWDDMEKIWDHVFYKELGVSPEEHPVLMSEANLNPKLNREKMFQLMFEKFHTRAMFVSDEARLSYYSFERGEGVVVAVGDGVSIVAPHHCGFPIPNAVRRLDFAGRDLTEYLMKLLAQDRGYFFTTTGEREVVREIKEKFCCVPDDSLASETNYLPITYKLPNGQEITIGDERFRCPEALFCPSVLGQKFVGLHELVYQSIMNCDIDLRRGFFANILLSGGTTTCPGLHKRLEKEISALVPNGVHVRVPTYISLADRINATWIGGSILASLSTFYKLWITKEQYEGLGPNIAYYRDSLFNIC